jgi:CheY-like chemotaxis protein
MVTRLIQDNTEKIFLDSLQTSLLNRRLMLCLFADLAFKPDPERVLRALKDVLLDAEGELYFYPDGDLVVAWQGRGTEIEELIPGALKAAFPEERRLAGKDVFQAYDTIADSDKLQMFGLHKLKNLQDQTQQEKRRDKPMPPHFSEQEREMLLQRIARRKARKMHKEVYALVVEDQEFSRKLLMSLLQKTVYCHGAVTAAEATRLYAEIVPDLVFLDIELPDADGHDLAALFRQHDPDAIIVMVTANNYMEDVVKAKANHVQGFIAKPYTKKKIMEVLDTYIKRRNG